MPGDMEGSPALTFAPLPSAEAEAPAGSLQAMMERRFEAYKTHVVRPFFRDHFARLDRQIVLVDVLAALNGGPQALDELRRALRSVLSCFRTGRLSFLGSLVDRRIDRILFVATKADHIHHADHDRLERSCRISWPRRSRRPNSPAPRWTWPPWPPCAPPVRRGVTRGGETFLTIAGTPMEGQRIGERVFDGTREVGLFPGDLPDDPAGGVRQRRGTSTV